MPNNNFYNMNQISKNALEKNKKIEKGINETLSNYYANLRAEEDAKQKALTESALSGARFGYASTYARSKNRINAMNEEINYQNTSAITGMTEMVAQVVEKALLLDENEFAKYNPDYKSEIRNVISGFLKEAAINENITNPDTLTIMEYVARKLPDAKTGKSLTEDDISQYIAANTPSNVNDSIEKLSGDVSSKVANLVEKEQLRAQEIDNDVKKARGEKEPEAKDNKQEDLDELRDAYDKGEIDDDDLDELVDSGKLSDAEFDDIVGAIEDTNSDDDDEEYNEPEDNDAEGASVISDAPSSGGIKKQIQMLPDGTMNVNIYEKALIRETPRCGLIESLAVNEAANMLKEGKEYNADACLANAIMYVTITEAMDTMGLMNVGDNGYAKIIKAAGGNLVNESGIRMKPGEKVEDALNRNGVRHKDGRPVKGSDKFGDIDFKNVKDEDKKPLTESVICSQEAPRLNKYSSMDLAERIRMKRLAEESHIESLND